jgi:hypothetical protein
MNRLRCRATGPLKHQRFLAIKIQVELVLHVPRTSHIRAQRKLAQNDHVEAENHNVGRFCRIRGPYLKKGQIVTACNEVNLQSWKWQCSDQNEAWRDQEKNWLQGDAGLRGLYFSITISSLDSAFSSKMLASASFAAKTLRSTD